MAGRIGEGVGRGTQLGVLAAVEGDADHFSQFGAGDDPGGIKVGAVFFSVDDVQSHQGVYGLGVGDFIAIGELRRACGHNHHAQEHDKGQSQAKRSFEVLHAGVSSLQIRHGVRAGFMSVPRLWQEYRLFSPKRQ
ncbi:hypothetical protein SDC9_104021 [bioreactor metagenome]|uniref:Uncharacterized protein n=1 Tax=bioreactor metagenome TaxID=1076179 RepID=A0A645AVQ9_9ZZZZ